MGNPKYKAISEILLNFQGIKTFIKLCAKIFLRWMRADSNFNRSSKLKIYIGYVICAFSFGFMYIAERYQGGDRWSDEVISIVAMIFGSVFAANAIAAMFHQHLSKKILNYIDLVWMIATGIAIVIALSQTPSQSAIDYANKVKENSAKNFEKALSYVKVIENEECSKPDMNNGSEDLCKQLGKIRTPLEIGFAPTQQNIATVMNSIPENRQRTMLEISRLIGYDKIKNKIMDDIEITQWEHWNSIQIYSLRLIIALLFALRTVKTTSELWWMKKETFK
ncbi:hypothetical protein GGE65_005150 [Skermanella aerolata]|uniref:hypothetical protein n=1 Tax=Skermanella aerolata TaxID=393310 RepID=UPI003D2601DE